MPFVGQHSDIGAPPVLVGGQVAQSVEQRPEKPCVGGSIPSLATFFRLAIIAAIVFAAVGLFGSPVIANDNNGKWLAQTYHAFALAAQGEHLAAAKQLAKIGESRNDPDYFYEAANEAMLAGDSPLAIQYGKRRIALGGGDMARRDYIEILLYGGRWQQAEDEMAALSAEGLLNDTQLFSWLRHYNNTQANAIGAKLFSDNGRDYLARMGIASGNWHLAIAAVAGMQTNKDNYVLYFLEARRWKAERESARRWMNISPTVVRAFPPRMLCRFGISTNGKRRRLGFFARKNLHNKRQMPPVPFWKMPKN